MAIWDFVRRYHKFAIFLKSIGRIGRLETGAVCMAPRVCHSCKQRNSAGKGGAMKDRYDWCLLLLTSHSSDSKLTKFELHSIDIFTVKYFSRQSVLTTSADFTDLPSVVTTFHSFHCVNKSGIQSNGSDNTGSERQRV